MPSLEGAWTAQYSGGVPESPTWANNPQFAIRPAVDGATYEIEVVQHQPAGGEPHRFALWVMKADSENDRKVEYKGLIEHTKVGREKRTITVLLPLRGKGYVALCAPQDPGAEGTFTITVTSLEDSDVSLEPLQDIAGQAAARPPQAAAAAPAALSRGGGPKPLGAFNPSTGGQTPAPLKRQGTSFSGKAPDNQPVIETIGQGLSKKLQAESDQAIADALAASEGGKYEDAGFPPTDASLGAPADSLGVVSWKRLEEIEPRGDGSLFSRAEGVGLRMGSLHDEWLVGSLNVVGTNVDVAKRIFVDSSHAENGFYVVRLYAEDPNSDDDWAVVVIDDRLPCNADGLPAFGRGIKPGALWAPLVEKAVAKRYGNYMMLASSAEGGEAGHGPGEGTLRGLELVTGGKARELDVPSAMASKEEHDGPWEALKESLNTNQVVCARCDGSDPRAADATKMGIMTDKTYAVIVAGDMPVGRLMRLRGFAGDPEWSGKWSDNDKAWNNMLRQQLAYSKDSDDGTFWMSYADFVKHFSAAFATRYLDDRWTRMSVKSRWMDLTAGGGPSHISWRENYQWRVELPREMELTFQVSLPDPLLAPSSMPPMGLVLVRSNPGEDARRRRLRMKDRSEVVFEVEPKLTRRLQVSTRLPPTGAGQSYVLVPYLMNPGAESKFTLTILVDDLNDDGVPDITFEPILPNPPNKEDWFVKRASGTYARSAAAPNQQGFGQNARTSFKLAKGGGDSRVFVCLETVGAATDMRAVEGMQSSPAFPTIGLVLLPTAASEADDRMPANALEVGPANTDGLWLEATLAASGETHVLVPYLGPGQASSELTYTLAIYSDSPIADADGGGGNEDLWECESGPECVHGPTCPFRVVVEKMAKMESMIDERIAFLDELLCRPVPAGF